MNFKTGDTIIAISDSKLPNASLPSGLERAYRRGDVFKVYRESIEDSSGLRLIIWHPILGELEVNPQNFKILQL